MRRRVNSAVDHILAPSPLPFNAAINRMRPVDATPIPLADVADGLVQHRAVRHLLKARFYPITTFFGPRRPEFSNPFRAISNRSRSASGARSQSPMPCSIFRFRFFPDFFNGLLAVAFSHCTRFRFDKSSANSGNFLRRFSLTNLAPSDQFAHDFTHSTLVTGVDFCIDTKYLSDPQRKCFRREVLPRFRSISLSIFSLLQLYPVFNKSMHLG